MSGGEVARVTASTRQVSFEWIESDVTLRVQDQGGVDIAGSLIQRPSYARLFPPPPGLGHLTGTTIRLPITDSTVYPTIQGSESDGYHMKVIPGVLGWAQEHGNFVGRLLRSEVAPVTASTGQVSFEWIESDVTLRVRDQGGVDIPGSLIQLASYAGLFPSLPGLGHLT